MDHQIGPYFEKITIFNPGIQFFYNESQLKNPDIILYSQCEEGARDVRDL